MSPRFEAWRTDLTGLTEGEATFQKWLFVRSAGVLFGGKGGELLVLSTSRCRLSIDSQLECITALSHIWQYRHAVLFHGEMGRASVIIYSSFNIRREETCLS